MIQIFYLDQIILWEELNNDRVIECFDSVNNLKDIDNGKMIHIPYREL